MSTEFTDSRGKLIAVRSSNGEGKGTRLTVVVGPIDFESQIWLVSETGELISRKQLITQNSVEYTKEEE